MANCCCSSGCVWRGVALAIGWLTFLPALCLFVFTFFLQIFVLHKFEKGICSVYISFAASLCWLYGTIENKPRYMLFLLIWCAYLLSFFISMMDQIDYIEKIVIISSYLVLYSFAVLSYDFIVKTSIEPNLNLINFPHRPRVNNPRDIIIPIQSRNYTSREVPVKVNDDNISLIMMVD